MGDEEAFLRAIRENPGDDGPKLVYADWLDERGDPRGELIRLTCELNHIRRRLLIVPARLAELSQQLDSHWLLDVFGRFRLILQSCPAGKKVAAMKAIRQVTGYDQKDCRDLFARRLPQIILDGVTWEVVERARAMFDDIAPVRVERSTKLEPFPPGAPLVMPKYKIVLRSYLNGAKAQTVKALRSITGLSGEAARELVESLPRVLAERMTRDEVERYRAALRPFAEIDAVPMGPRY